MQKTIGGDRLGSGKKMKVELRNYERSTHDMSYIWRSTMSAGTLVPYLCEVALPGDTFDIDLDVDIMTHPTIGPLFGSYKIQLDVFECPIRLYNAALHNNALGIGMNMKQIYLPTLTIKTTDTDRNDIDNYAINPSSIFSYLGIRGPGYNDLGGHPTREFNAVPFIAYWDIFKNYYANKQEPYAYVIHTDKTIQPDTVTSIKISTNNVERDLPNQIKAGDQIRIYYSTEAPDPTNVLLNIIGQPEQNAVTAVGSTFADSGGGFLYAIWHYADAQIQSWSYPKPQQQKPTLTPFLLQNIDELRNHLLTLHPQTPINLTNTTFLPYLYTQENNSLKNSQEGLAVKTYQSDLFNNWINNELITGTNGISEITAISTVSGSFTIDTLNLAKKVYDMLNRIAISGGTYDDWLDTVYTHERITRAETPMYMGGLIRELAFQEVVSNSASSDQPLGTLAGRGAMTSKKKGGHITIKVAEPSYIIGIISLTPRLDYSQGNKWDVHLKTLDDLHKPQLDEIGFQDLITEQMAWWDTHWDGHKWIQRSAGKQPAWINYMTNVNQTRGNFAIQGNEMFMTLNRRYEPDTAGYIKDLTTYIDPAKYNNIFAYTALDAQNFWTQISVDITARRKMSAKIMPNL